MVYLLWASVSDGRTAHRILVPLNCVGSPLLGWEAAHSMFGLTKMAQFVVHTVLGDLFDLMRTISYLTSLCFLHKGLQIYVHDTDIFI